MEHTSRAQRMTTPSQQAGVLLAVYASSSRRPLTSQWSLLQRQKMRQRPLAASPQGRSTRRSLLGWGMTLPQSMAGRLGLLPGMQKGTRQRSQMRHLLRRPMTSRAGSQAGAGGGAGAEAEAGVGAAEVRLSCTLGYCVSFIVT